jgi:hypothetical protein
MKTLVVASMAALAAICLFSTPTLRAQAPDAGQISLPADQFNAYQNASTQPDPTAKAAALENFLQTYPQSPVKKTVLDMLIDAYYQTRKFDQALGACTRLLQVDPNNLKAILYSVIIKKGQCGQTSDAQTCDDAAALAHKGLMTPKPADTSDAEWQKLTAGAFPIFHSAIALDFAVSKKDFASAIAEYKSELMAMSETDSESNGLQDTLLLAQAYLHATPQDLVDACWFYARVWDFAPANFKPSIEKQLDPWYIKYHGGLDGLDDLKAAAAKSIFPSNFVIKPAPTPAEKIHTILETTPDLSKLALSDKELVLAYGSKDDADKLWAIMKDQVTPVPGVVTDATASTIKVAVTDDAKQSMTPDFIVNLKEPLKDADIPAAKFEFKLQPAAQLNGTYDTYTQVPATATVPQSVQIVLRDGFVQPEEKKKAPVHKPTAAHKPAAAH